MPISGHSADIMAISMNRMPKQRSASIASLLMAAIVILIDQTTGYSIANLATNIQVNVHCTTIGPSTTVDTQTHT